MYRAVFTAQAGGRWQEADQDLAQLGDKRLLGHVLAERYGQRGASLAELQTWLLAYRDLPEAGDMYQQARKLHGGMAAKLARPATGDAPAGFGIGDHVSTGFRPATVRDLPLNGAERRAIAPVERSLHQGNPAAAKALLEETLQRQPLPVAELASLQAQIAAGYFYKGDTDEARRLTDAGYLHNDALAMWIKGLSAFKQGDAAAAAASFARLADQGDLGEGGHAAAAFWAYRAFQRAGDKKAARAWLLEAAREPNSFYGLLAANLSGRDARAGWSWRLPQLDRHAVELVAAHPAGARALALLQIGRNELAESELLALNPQGRRDLQEAMLALAEKSRMPSLALRLGGMAVNDNGKPYDAALYPLPPWQPSEGFSVERALIYALMRHESHFDPLAVSSQGACGLMQLMPATAERMNGTVAAGAHAARECPDRFFDPTVNVGLGQRYVRQLAEQPMIGDNLLLLLAAYNGGPGRLSHRNDTDASNDPLLFIESLPARETHDYVQQVLIQYWTYRARLNQPLTSLDQLARGAWPRYALQETAPEIGREASMPGYAVASNAPLP